MERASRTRHGAPWQENCLSCPTGIQSSSTRGRPNESRHRRRRTDSHRAHPLRSLLSRSRRGRTVRHEPGAGEGDGGALRHRQHIPDARRAPRARTARRRARRHPAPDPREPRHPGDGSRVPRVHREADGRGPRRGRSHGRDGAPPRRQALRRPQPPLRSGLRPGPGPAGPGRHRRAGLGGDLRGILAGHPRQSLRAARLGRPLGAPAPRRHLPEPGAASGVPHARLPRSAQDHARGGPEDRPRADLLRRRAPRARAVRQRAGLFHGVALDPALHEVRAPLRDRGHGAGEPQHQQPDPGPQPGFASGPRPRDARSRRGGAARQGHGSQRVPGGPWPAPPLSGHGRAHQRVLPEHRRRAAGAGGRRGGSRGRPRARHGLGTNRSHRPERRGPRERTGSMKALVTGGTGFLGRQLVERLALEGDEVSVLGRGDRAAAGLRGTGARVVPGDLRRWPSLQKAVEGVDVIYHCAGKVEAGGRWVDFLEVNVLGTERLIQAALEHGVRRFIHVSSIGVYPERPDGAVIGEDDGYDTNTGRGGYTRSKVMADQLAFWYVRERSAPITVIRPATIYGPGGKNNLVRVGVKKGRLNVIFGDGANVMPLVYVDNVVDALVLAAHRAEAVGRAYNVVDDDRITQREYLTRMGEALGRAQTTTYLPLPTVRLLASGADLAKAALRGGRRSPQGMFSRITRSLQSGRYDTSRAKSELGWKPKVDFEEALRRVRKRRTDG